VTPRLLDEWQAEPGLWNYVRRAVDDRRARGQFILTGSASPTEDVTQHSGAGRISRLRMRTMSLWESERSTGEVSLGAVMAGDEPTSATSALSVEEIATWIAVGGWPAVQDDDVVDALGAACDHVDLLVDVDRVGRPAALTVITGSGFAHRRPDGVNVVPIGVLRE
jgi:hypothetical protein